MTTANGGPEADAGAALAAELERFMAETQHQIVHLLNDCSFSQSDLSRRLGVSKQRVNQMFRGRGRNLTMRTVAHIFHCVGEQPVLITRREFRSLTERIRMLEQHDDPGARLSPASLPAL